MVCSPLKIKVVFVFWLFAKSKTAFNIQLICFFILSELIVDNKEVLYSYKTKRHNLGKYYFVADAKSL